MTALYTIIKFITFPGALVRGMWEQIICRICGVPVEDNRYLRNDEMIGHIEHEFMPTARSAFAFCFVPAFMNAVLAFLLAMFPMMNLFFFGVGSMLTKIISIVCYWLACSLFLNSYPLIEDAMNMWDMVYHHGTIIQKIFYTPGIIFLYADAYLEKYCLTAVIVIVCTVLMILK